MYQYPKVKKLTSSTFTLLTGTETKEYLKVDHALDDDIIDRLIIAGQGFVESETGITLFESTFEQKQEGDCDEIELLREPVISINSVTYYDDFDSTGTVLTANTDYRNVDNFLLSPNNYFTKGRQKDGYVVNFTAGKYTTTVSSDDEDSALLKSAALRFIAWLYENREEYLVEIQEGINVKYDYNKVPQGIIRLLYPISVKVGM